MKKNNKNGRLFTFAVVISVVMALLKVFGIIHCSWLIVALPVIIDLILGLVFFLFAVAMIVIFRKDKRFMNNVKDALDDLQ